MFEQFFTSLWERDETGAGMDIIIPDTILISAGTPYAWFYTDHDLKRIFKRAKSKLTEGEILKHFESENESSPEFRAVSLNTPAQVKFLSLEQTRCVFRKQFSGVLQSYLQPSGKYHEHVEVIWSPHLVKIEKVQGADVFKSKIHSCFKNSVADGSSEQSISSVRARFPVHRLDIIQEIKLVCCRISSHLEKIKKIQVTNMSLVFLVNSQNKVVLQYPSAVAFKHIGIQDSLALSNTQAELQNQSKNEAEMIGNLCAQCMKELSNLGTYCAKTEQPSATKHTKKLCEDCYLDFADLVIKHLKSSLSPKLKRHTASLEPQRQKFSTEHIFKRVTHDADKDFEEKRATSSGYTAVKNKKTSLSTSASLDNCNFKFPKCTIEVGDYSSTNVDLKDTLSANLTTQTKKSTEEEPESRIKIIQERGRVFWEKLSNTKA